MRWSLLIIMVVLLATLFAPYLAPYDPMATGETTMQPPTRQHLLGTDLLGRDVLSRVIFGGRHTLMIAGIATLIAVLPGTCIGMSAAMCGSWINQILNLCVNSLLSIPALIIALVIMTLLGQGSWQVAVAVGISQVAVFARVTRSVVIVVRRADYIESARAIGAKSHHIVCRYILPNVVATLMGYAGVVFGYSILNSAGLSFLGLGGELGVPDWGVILAEGRLILRTAPWVAVAPGFVIFLTVSAVNSIADSLFGSQKSNHTLGIGWVFRGKQRGK